MRRLLLAFATAVPLLGFSGVSAEAGGYYGYRSYCPPVYRSYYYRYRPAYGYRPYYGAYWRPRGYFYRPYRPWRAYRFYRPWGGWHRHW